ncbi:RNA polymerase sigma-70 factor (sigma-E family) [Saccharopolyspora lacisalsi]|uniref:RNA polymerase sigma-70 factor (Sigma-E family) n=1 Tax=Halosaccharopolyspora lacisalsi TaxID=1000566 RepID=A0A839E3N4_9PSEU|nr:SigE family RNA polymerase sigma factor [Halosaccharopolyspora lacisalsi]MBA8827660.1 RNA polymerase sigma-70 factor (sigma-E family) [Halosaccharopolyspora lacisalsi]
MRVQYEESFRVFARDQAAALRRSAYLLCGDWHLAEDLVQNTFTKLYRAWKRVDDTTKEAYARKALMRAWLDERRRPWRRVENRSGVIPDSGSTGSDPEVAGQRARTRNLVAHALTEVPPRQRAVLVLRYWEDLPIAEVAAALRCSEGTVKSQSSRGLQSLREAIARYDPDLVGVDAEGTA